MSLLRNAAGFLQGALITSCATSVSLVNSNPLLELF